MPLFTGRGAQARPVYNDYRLVGGGTSGQPLTGKVSALTGKPLLHSAIGHSEQSVFTKLEQTAKANMMGPPKDTYAFDAAPRFNSLTELETAIGRPFRESEWVKTVWSTLEHEDGATDWRFNDRWPEFSAKHQVTAADRTSLISFINSLGDVPVDKPVKGFDGVKRVYLLRRLELDGSAPMSNFNHMSNHPSVGALERAQNLNVTLNDATFTSGRPVKVLDGAAITIGTGQLRNAMSFVGHVKAAIEWKADGKAQPPLVLQDGVDTSNFRRDAPLVVPPGTRHVEYEFSVEHAPLPGKPGSKLLLDGSLGMVRSFEIVPAASS